MTTSDNLLSPENTLCGLSVNSKKSLLESVAKHIHQELPHETWESIFERLIAREKIGTTGFGQGIAIPHCRLSSCTQAMGVFTKLSHAIDFDAVDQQPVDLIFTLIVPEEENAIHLEILASIAAIFDSNALRISLRDADSDLELFKRINKMLES